MKLYYLLRMSEHIKKKKKKWAPSFVFLVASWPMTKFEYEILSLEENLYTYIIFKKEKENAIGIGT